MAATTVTAILAATFIGSLGINTHVDYTTGPYSNRSITANAVNYLGVKNLRDCPESSRAATVWPAISQATGAKFIAYMPRSSPTAMQQALARLPQLKGYGVLNYVEGANEPDTAPAVAAGNSLSYSKTFQQKVHSMGQSLGLKVINLSVGAGWTSADGWMGDYDSIGNLAAYADFANAHTYPAVASTMPYKTVNRINDLAQLGAVGRPIFISEMGWNTGSFSQAVVAKNLLNGLMDAALLKNAKTYIFALFDDASGKWGIMNADGTPRPAGKAFRNLVTLLKDSGKISSGSLAFELVGMQTERRILFRKADGAYWLAIWDEVSGARTITLKLGSAANSIKVYDPTNSTTPIQTVTHTSSVSVSVNDRPMLIRIALGSTVASIQDQSTKVASAVAMGSADTQHSAVLPVSARSGRAHAEVRSASTSGSAVARSELNFSKTSAFMFELPSADEEPFLPDARVSETVAPGASGGETPAAEISAADVLGTQDANAPETASSEAEALPPVTMIANDDINPPDTLMSSTDDPPTEDTAGASGAQATKVEASGPPSDAPAAKSGAADPAAVDATINTSASNSTVAASDNTNMIVVRGTGNTVNASPATTLIYATQGKNIINASSGATTISIGGAGNEVNIGNGTTRIEDNGLNTVIKFHSIGAGQTDLYGAILSQGTKLNLAPILAGTEWDGKQDSLGNFLRVELSGTTTVISVVPSGLSDGASHQVVALHNVSNLTLADLLRQAIIT